MEVKNKRDVPKVRFNIYRKRWKKKKFKDFTKLSQGLQIAISDRFTEDAETRHFYITNEFLNPNSRKKYYIESPSENVICTVDDILMTRTGNTGKVITNVSGAFHNNFFKVTYEKNDTAKLFLYYLLLSYDVQKEILIRAGNSTIPDLNHGDFYSIKTFIPTIEEQSAIGSLFRLLDDLLASYKDNLANYQSLKATMLSKMFPKAGQTVPEIRLDGFEGEWKLYELKSRAETITKGTTPKDKSWQGEVNYIKTESINRDTGSLVRTASTSLDEHLGYLKRSILKEDDVLFSIVGTLGVVGIVDKKDLPANTNQQIAIIRLKRDDAIFMLNFLKSPRIKSFIKSDSTIGAQPSLSLWQIEKIKVSLPPSLEEQQAIGTYFSNLDNLIASHQEKISQLETLKKKLLQDMFI
ncbi:restriction endonuclease subunit S [Streptococcus thermophilus]|uniref:restriction endonuclease subunit S n=1 Tax=Streptococcus thermophilus TaxID=1308 RepID=UPI0020C5BB5E|nr:restriction endonuclease subunit S [Streptococcus thermophilus]